MRTIKNLLCTQCGNPYQGYLHSQRFCSADCRKKEEATAMTVGTDLLQKRISGEVQHGASWKWRMKLPYPEKMLIISVPYSPWFSKNRMWQRAKYGGVFVNRETQTVIDDIIYQLKGKEHWVEDKVYLDILIQRPHFRGDPVNFIDVICDAVKVGIGIDDRYFCISRLDWQIVKENPKVFIGIWQADSIQKRVCSTCGQMLPTDNFVGKAGRNKRGKYDAKVCIKCKSESRKLGKIAMRSEV